LRFGSDHSKPSVQLRSAQSEKKGSYCGNFSGPTSKSPSGPNELGNGFARVTVMEVSELFLLEPLFVLNDWLPFKKGLQIVQRPVPAGKL